MLWVGQGKVTAPTKLTWLSWVSVVLETGSTHFGLYCNTDPAAVDIEVFIAAVVIEWTLCAPGSWKHFAGINSRGTHCRPMK